MPDTFRVWTETSGCLAEAHDRPWLASSTRVTARVGSLRSIPQAYCRTFDIRVLDQERPSGRGAWSKWLHFPHDCEHSASNRCGSGSSRSFLSRPRPAPLVIHGAPTDRHMRAPAVVIVYRSVLAGLP